MDQPVFLTLGEIVRIHAAMVERYGGRPGVRDPGLLDSAAAMPRAMFGGEYLHPDLAAMAAAYLFHIVGNHPFFDGNKRAGAAAAIVFLILNGVEVEADQDGLIEVTMSVARGEAAKDGVAAFFRSIAR